MAVRRLASWSQADFGQVGYVWKAVFTSLSSRACKRKWRKDHMTGRRQPYRSQSFRSVPISVVGMITIVAVNNAVWMMASHFALKTDPVSFVKTGCQKPGLHKPRLRRTRIVARPPPSKWDHGRFRGDPLTRRLFVYSFQAYQVRRIVRCQAVENSHKFLSTQVLASSVSAVGRPSSHRSDHRRSRTPERKRRHGEEKRQDSPRHQSSRRDGHSSDRRESQRARSSSSGGASLCRRAESGSVSKVSDTRPSGSSSRHHHHSSGDHRSLSSTSSRASPDRKSQPSHCERRRESSDRTGQTYVPRRDVQLSPMKSKAPEKRTIMVVASPARQIHVESAPEVQVPAPVADGSAGAGPAASDGSATADGPATRNGPATGNDPTTGDGSATGDGPATGDG